MKELRGLSHDAKVGVSKTAKRIRQMLVRQEIRYKDFVEARKNTLKVLDEKIAHIDDVAEDGEIVNVVGSGAGVLGGLAVIGGILGAPFTGGASIAAVVAGGTALGVAGAATNVIGGTVVNDHLKAD